MLLPAEGPCLGGYCSRPGTRAGSGHRQRDGRMPRSARPPVSSPSGGCRAPGNSTLEIHSLGIAETVYPLYSQQRQEKAQDKPSPGHRKTEDWPELSSPHFSARWVQQTDHAAGLLWGDSAPHFPGPRHAPSGCGPGPSVQPVPPGASVHACVGSVPKTSVLQCRAAIHRSTHGVRYGAGGVGTPFMKRFGNTDCSSCPRHRGPSPPSLSTLGDVPGPSVFMLITATRLSLVFSMSLKQKVTAKKTKTKAVFLQ